MSQNILSGKSGSTNIGATSYSFGKWKVALKTNLPKVTNWNSGGFQQLVSGITEATLTISGPYDAGNMPFTVGNSYIWLLNWTNVLGLSVPAIIESIDADNDVDGNPTISITARSSGNFTAAIT